MRVIPPLTITGTMVTSSSIAEPDTSVGEVAWVSGTVYAVNDLRVDTTAHAIYSRLIAGAGTTRPELDATNWLYVGPTNKFAVFDLYRGTDTTFTSSYSVVFAPGTRIDTLALLSCTLQDVTISITSVSSGGTVLYYTGSMVGKKSILKTNIPPALDLIITITSSASGSIGAIVVGISEYIGYTLKGHSNDALNFSIITRDDFGTSILTRRRSVPKTSQRLIIPKSILATAIKVRDTLNAVPAVWYGLDDDTEGYFEALLILGIYREFTITIDYPEFCSCNLELEEL